MPDDIFSRFRGAASPDADADDGSGTEFRRTGGAAMLQESEILAAIDRVPALPQIVGQILQRVGDVHSSAGDLGALIEQDMVLAGKVLKLVNSAFYRRRVPVGSIREAVSIIGFASLKSLVLAASTSNILMVDLEPYGMVRGGLWRNSMATASVARAIGIRAKVAAELAEEFFAAGLLRDVGLLVLSPFLARSGVRLRATPGRSDILLAERQAIGFDHGWVGHCLAQKWQLPEVLAVAIGRHHHLPAGEAASAQAHLGAVRLAERLVYAAGIGVQPDHPFEVQIDAQAIRGAGLDAVAFAALCAEVPALLKDDPLA